ncbi:MAG: pirin family protein [Bacteroidales bacterium]|nr:pirin family protein [Bacteroidales bacterium]
MYNRLILDIRPMGFNWPTRDPFLFCVHHLDLYPRGNGEMGPAASLAGRNLGQDFTTKDGWRMYHGERIPGFPAHPHRGFETVTVVLDGFVDHSDSHGSAGRYGNGDVQWMTAGSGLQHAEMFPLVDLLSDESVIIENGRTESFLLLLQGKPVAEQVAQHGPFVMNSAEEIRQAFTDYRTTQFGGWPWDRYDNVHPAGSGRFARYADGRDEERK